MQGLEPGTRIYYFHLLYLPPGFDATGTAQSL